VSARRLNPARRSFVARLAEGDTYGTLLVLIVAAYMIMALVEDSKWARTVTGALFGATLLLALHTSQVRGRIIRIAAVLVGLLVAWSAALAITDREPFTGSSHLTILLIALAPAVILYRVFRHPVINVETILGAIDAYLLIGISFAALYLMQEDVDPHFFSQGAASGVKFLYFSFVVITTLGFGDLTPRTDVGRVVVSLEALLGQIFLVTVVAVLVANIGRATRHVSASAAVVRDPADDLAEELAEGVTEKRAEEAVDPETD
jgi:Ion channel